MIMILVWDVFPYVMRLLPMVSRGLFMGETVKIRAL